MPDGRTVSVLFIDTEGFESTGKSNSYDDRIFAVSSLLSSVLIYNLPETIRESDIAKLSFAVELAQGLYDRQTDEGQQQLQQQGGDAGTAGQEQGGGAFAPGAMLWLIQRDFLQVGGCQGLPSRPLRTKWGCGRCKLCGKAGVEIWWLPTVHVEEADQQSSECAE